VSSYFFIIQLQSLTRDIKLGTVNFVLCSLSSNICEASMNRIYTDLHGEFHIF
jgi:hypothetical protein